MQTSYLMEVSHLPIIFFWKGISPRSIPTKPIGTVYQFQPVIRGGQFQTTTQAHKITTNTGMYNIYACILTSNYEKAFVFFLIARFSNTFERRQYAGRYRNFILKYIIEALHFIFFDVSIKSSVMTLVVNTKFVFL